MRQKPVATLLLVAAFCACSRYETSLEIDSVDSDQPSISEIESLKLSPKDTVLDADGASRVARLFLLQDQGVTKSAAQKQIREVVPYSGSAAHPLMYAVNFEGDQGFILVSATRKFFPILAVVENGRFDESIKDSPVSVMLEEYENGITFYENQPADSAKQFSAAWKDYLQYICPAPVVTKLDGVDAIVVSQIQAWEAAGYDVYPLFGGAPESLPQSVYETYVALAAANANDDFDYMETSFILRETTSYNQQVGPLLTTHWHQGAPYFNSTPLKQNPSGVLVHCPVGCGAIAMGQIMRYHQWPQSFNWAQMPNTLSSSITTETTLSQFLYEIGSRAHTIYGWDGSDSMIFSYWADAFLFYSYSATLRIPHSASDAIASIQNYRPVFMRGKNSSNNSAHAWVADGNRSGSVYETYSLQTLSYPTLEFYQGGTPFSVYSGDASLIHINMGAVGGYLDGWYTDTSNYSTVPDYTSNRMDLIITPNY